jgi:hypothetical protein
MSIKLLGKNPASYDSRTLKLAQYLIKEKLPPLPPKENLYQKVSKFDILGNDQYGCCVVVGAAHTIQTWSANAAREQRMTAQQVIKTYLGLTGGYDTGLDVLAFLKYWRKNPLWGHPLGAYVSIDPRSSYQVQAAIYLFGGVFLGLSLPEYIQDATVWDIKQPGQSGDDEPGSWGGHLVHLGAYGMGNIDYLISTWTDEMPTTKRFVAAYADEGYALLALDWFKADHKSPAGFAYKDLLSDLNRITQA